MKAGPGGQPAAARDPTCAPISCTGPLISYNRVASSPVGGPGKDEEYILFKRKTLKPIEAAQ